MIRMKVLVTMFTKDQEIITAKEKHQEACRQIAEEGFTQIYNETLKTSSEYQSDVRTATVKGACIGAMVAGLGLIGIGALGYKKLSNRQKMKKIKKEEEA
jgi:hypothetical protein